MPASDLYLSFERPGDITSIKTNWFVIVRKPCTGNGKQNSTGSGVVFMHVRHDQITNSLSFPIKEKSLSANI